jgi:hypothetical protein
MRDIMSGLRVLVLTKCVNDENTDPSTNYEGNEGARVEGFKASKWIMCMYLSIRSLTICAAEPPQPQTRHQWSLTSGVVQLRALS